MKTLSGKEFCKLLEKEGWILSRINGSHHIYTKKGCRERISVPVHGKRPLKKGLQSALQKMAGMKLKGES